MNILYIECNMGAAGDMLMSALTELHPEPNDFMNRLQSLDIPHVTFERKRTVKCGIEGTHIEVLTYGSAEHEHHRHEHEHHHTGMEEIEHIIGNLHVNDSVKKNALSVYSLIAEAESHAHGREVSEIHFHEVGAMDAVADVVGVCMLMDELSPDKIVVSPVHVGSGSVHCAHGVLPVPAPATAYILKDVPVYGGAIQGELCTPTGAALLKHFANEFGDMPQMKLKKTGYGMGTKDFEAANCVRVMLGETKDSEKDVVYELSCNIDDMTGEELGFAVNALMQNGALDVFTTALGMKKCRPGIMLTCICGAEKREEMARLIFANTSTIGIREKKAERYVLKREVKNIDTAYGAVRMKISEGYGVKKTKLEYDDVERIAKENGVSFAEAGKRIAGEEISSK